MVNIKFVKTHPDAKLPTKAYNTDNGFDIYAVEAMTIPPNDSRVVSVGLQVAYITPGFGFAIKPKSGLGFRHNLQPHLGEIDQTYRGGMGIKIYNFGLDPYTYNKGDKVAQFKVERVYETTVEFTDTISQTDRGDQGFGSTGK